MKDLEDGGKEYVRDFDYVVICNGHYSVPRIPEVKGQELFKGEQIHSVKYRKADQFSGKWI